MKTENLLKTITRAATVALITAAPLFGHGLAQAQETPQPDQRRDESRQLEEKARDLKASGRHDEAKELMNRAEALRAEVGGSEGNARPDQPAPLDDRRRQELEKQHKKLIAQLEMVRSAETERQQEHLRIAIENLHAAGIHDVADRLARRMELGRQTGRSTPGASGSRRAGELRGDSGPGRIDERSGPRDGLNGLRAELAELRRSMREMQGRLDELSRERR